MDYAYFLIGILIGLIGWIRLQDHIRHNREGKGWKKFLDSYEELTFQTANRLKRGSKELLPKWRAMVATMHDLGAFKHSLIVANVDRIHSRVSAKTNVAIYRDDMSVPPAQEAKDE